MRGVLERVEVDRCAIDEQGARSNAAPSSINLTPKFCWMISTAAANPRFEGTRRETIILFWERVTLAPERWPSCSSPSLRVHFATSSLSETRTRLVCCLKSFSP